MFRDRESLAYSIVMKAGWKLLQMFEERDSKPISVQEKSYLDYISDADEKVNEMIVSEINMHFPQDDILSEELIEREIERKTNYSWIIDPLDGTHNYLNGSKEWGVLLAIERKKEVIWGMCYFPVLQEIFVAEKGNGAFCNGEKIKVFDVAELHGQMFYSDGTIRRKPREILRDIERFCRVDIGCRLRVPGSSPYGFTRVALGQAVIATNRLGKPWDIAAPALLVEEAGGKITDEKGNPWQIDSENLLATNGLVHEQALELFNS